MTVLVSQEMRPLIRFDLKKCAFCKICELSCSQRHYKKFGDSTSRITIVRKGPLILKCFICTRCDKRFCITACPTKALSYKGGNIVVDPKLCNSCGDCVRSCPFHGIKLHPETRLPIICDLCEGDPSCVKECPKGALSLVWLPERRKGS